MPLYEYGCDACGHTLEIQQKLADAPLTTCPSCGKNEIHKLISATSFVLKGGGWYKDGYSSKSDKAERTDKERTDKLQKSVDADKSKSAPAESSAAAAGPSPSSTPSTSGGSGTPDKAA